MTYFIRPEYAPKTDGVYVFEKTVELSAALDAELCVFAASRYILYINGVYICEGPCRSHEKVRYFDRVSAHLKKGQNRISVKVMHTTSFFTTVYDTPTPLLALEVGCGKQTVISTDATWNCRYLVGHALLCHGMCSLPPYECYDASEKDVDLPLIESDRAIFQSDGYFTRGGAAYPYILEERPIPMIYPAEASPLRLIRKGDGFAEYDAGAYTTAKVSFGLAKNSAVKVIYAECYETENGKYHRDDESGVLRGYYDTVKSADEDIAFETYWFRSFRYIRIEGDADALSSLVMRRVHYPLDIEGSFECSDPLLNKIWRVSENTMLCCLHEIISDCPYYEQQQYEFDSMVETAVLSALSSDLRLIKKCITEFARSQQPNGLLLSIYPASWALQIIPSYSLSWILMLKRYVEISKDLAFATENIGIMDGILGFFDRQIQEKGYLVRTRYWDFFDWVPEWENGTPPVSKDEAHTLYNLFYAIALDDAAFLARAAKRTALAEEYIVRKAEVLSKVRSLCYDQDKGIFRDGAHSTSYSTHSSILAILADAYDENTLNGFLDGLFRADIQKNGFSWNFLLFRALEKLGRYDLTPQFFHGWYKMLENGCTSWCENPDDPRSECHGWSSAPIYEFATNVLGVKVGLDEEIVIAPHTLHLSYAKGTVPSRFGTISVEWEKGDESFLIRIKSKEGIKKKFIHPSLGETVFYESFKEFKVFRE